MGGRDFRRGSSTCEGTEASECIPIGKQLLGSVPVAQTNRKAEWESGGRVLNPTPVRSGRSAVPSDTLVLLDLLSGTEWGWKVRFSFSLKQARVTGSHT